MSGEKICMTCNNQMFPFLLDYEEEEYHIQCFYDE